ncbi:MAG: hypothetical protein U0835_17020 [Isosphaeraceae bacterium]
MGAVYARLRGPTDPKTAMPTYGLVTADEIDPQYRKEKPRVQEERARPARPGVHPVRPLGGRRHDRPDALTMPRQRLEDRRALLAALDRARRDFDDRGQPERSAGTKPRRSI